MKITYTPNPLDTKVELDDSEKEILRLKIKLEQYEDMLFSAHFNITHRLKNNGALKAISVDEALEAARKDLDPDYWCSDEKSKLDERVDELLEHYILELQGYHCGDCTCVAMSCSKCHAERLIGVDTLKPFPGKHAMYHVSQAFSYKDGDEWKQRSLQDALAFLCAFNPQPPKDMTAWDKVGGWFSHLPRWKAEANEAYQYLLNYSNTHFKGEQQ